MLQKVKRGANTLAITVAMLALTVPAFGQGAPPGAATPTQAGSAPVVKKLSVNDAVQMALEQNLDLQVERVNPRVQDMSIASVKATWAPNLTSSLSTGSQNSPAGNVFTGATTLTNDSLGWSIGANQLLPWGGRYDVSWASARAQSNSLFDNINPRLTSSLNLSVTQPFLRNFRIDSTREQLIVTRKNREISDVQLRQTVLVTTRSVRNAYWDLSYARSSRIVQQQSLDLAKESLKNNEARVRIGTMAPIDIIQAQAEVASREEAVIRADLTVAQAEDRLRTLIMDPQTPDFWNMTFELTDVPVLQPAVVDVDAAVQRAWAQRTDLTVERKALEQNDVQLRYMHNQMKPDVSLNVRYGLTAQGGTLLNIDYADILNPVLVGPVNSVGYGSMYQTLLQRQYPLWSVGVTFGYPIGNSTADANYARAKLQYGQQQTQLRSAELTVATQVRDAARTVNANLKRVESTRASRDLQEKKLEAEQKKFAAGMSTFFFVLQAQRDLAQAQDSELLALLQYTRSVVDLETVQEAPLSGIGGLSIATGGSTMTGSTTTGSTTTGSTSGGQ